MPDNTLLQAFADYLVLVVWGKETADIENGGNEALKRLPRWGKKHKLKFSTSKTVLMPITIRKKLRFDNPSVLKLENTPIKMVKTFKYLGVLWDSNLTFIHHFKQVRIKVDVLTYRLNSIALRFYSRHPRIYPSDLP
ncbi:hypothetical protein AVEN_219515-1 [Araneus ventricosus]|uniref:Reverse transcriptase domain-containing protein n=1 Tax=Araneus ventricosus TaxID=182803 RepID=A0A4Y2BQD9_ARAVE|nr:hypothetical protein AVEN_219515-1 [Araneus ventricosus]